MRRQSRRWGIGVVLALIALGATVSWAGQPSGKPTIDASMTELVSEVRELRVAVERSSLIAAQAQLLLGRLQLQENRLGTLGRQAQEARTRTMDAQEARNDVARQLARMTEHVDQTSTADERQQVQAMVAEFKQRLKDLQAKVDQLRTDESAAVSALSEEQLRWSDFNTRLETLERSIAAAANPSRPPR